MAEVARLYVCGGCRRNASTQSSAIPNAIAAVLVHFVTRCPTIAHACDVDGFVFTFGLMSVSARTCLGNGEPCVQSLHSIVHGCGLARARLYSIDV